jgi:oligopeptide transport system substrate-binding protein
MRRAVRVRAVLAVLAVAPVMAAAAGCGGGDTGGEAGVVRASWGDPQNPLEPADTNEVQGGKVLDMVFRGLKKYDPHTGAARNWIADSITTPDQRTFTIRLKKGWTFSNGEPVTARSFTDAWNYGAAVGNEQVDSSFFSPIEGFDAVHPASGRPTARTLSGLSVKDDLTFTVKLARPFSTWPDTLGYAVYYPLPRTFFTHHAAWLKKPVGDGPYRIETYAKGSVMRLRRWRGYHGPDRPRNGGVDLEVYTSSDTAYTDLEAGNLDVVDDVPADQLKFVHADLGDRYINEPAGLNQSIAFPLYDKRWNGPKSAGLRRGLSMAIDRAAITRRIFRGTRTPATDWTSPVLGARGGFRAGLCGKPCTYDPAAARKAVAAAGGLPGGHMQIAYNADTGSHKEWIDAICNSINNTLHDDDACVGAPVGTFADFRTQIAAHRERQPFRSGWQMDYPLIQDFLEPLYRTGASSDDSGFSNPQFDRLVDRANAEDSTGAALGDFQAAEKVLTQQMPAIPLWYQNGNAGYSSYVSHVSLNAFSVPVYDEITVN